MSIDMPTINVEHESTVSLPPKPGTDMPDWDPDNPQHLWVLLLALQVQPDQWDPKVPVILANNQLMNVSGPGCWHCEEPWGVEVASRPCPGDPRDNHR